MLVLGCGHQKTADFMYLLIYCFRIASITMTTEKGLPMEMKSTMEGDVRRTNQVGEMQDSQSCIILHFTSNHLAFALNLQNTVYHKMEQIFEYYAVCIVSYAFCGDYMNVHII